MVIYYKHSKQINKTFDLFTSPEKWLFYKKNCPNVLLSLERDRTNFNNSVEDTSYKLRVTEVIVHKMKTRYFLFNMSRLTLRFGKIFKHTKLLFFSYHQTTNIKKTFIGYFLIIVSFSRINFFQKKIVERAINPCGLKFFLEFFLSPKNNL